MVHFLNFITDADKGMDVSTKYELALKRSRALGGKKYHNKQYGGGIVFQSYNISDLKQSICDIKITAWHKACVNFIKWYNEK